MEISVGFTDKDDEEMKKAGYVFECSEYGKVYYPKDGIVVSEKIEINYMEYPWITCFEVEGIQIII